MGNFCFSVCRHSEECKRRKRAEKDREAHERSLIDKEAIILLSKKEKERALEEKKYAQHEAAELRKALDQAKEELKMETLAKVKLEIDMQSLKEKHTSYRRIHETVSACMGFRCHVS